MGRAYNVIKSIVDRVPLVGMAYRNWRDSRSLGRVPVLTPLGFRIIGHPDMERGQYEMTEVEIVRKYLSSAEVFINVGANIGYYCCIARKAGKQVIAFEPIDLNLQYLYLNLKANGWDDVEVVPVAVSNRVGLTDIHGWGTGASLIHGWAGTPEGFSRTVPVSTLDTILGNRLVGKRCVFLVDVEGVERQVIEGAMNQLTLLPKPIWIVEISVTEHQPNGIAINPNLLATFELFWKNGYQASTVEEQPLIVSREEILAIIESRKSSFNTHNFLFT
jgi:FkbM family methyltransferase